MIPEFREFAERAEVLFSDLEAAPLRPFKALASDKNVPGIYVFYEDGTPVYVGRTRNLQGRLRAHVTRSHNSASFAFKRTRKAHSLGATYKPNMSRDAISTREPYKSTFLAEIEKIKAMEFRFLRVEHPIEQYMLELYATMAFGLELSGFDTH